MANFVWAVDRYGKLTKCTARLENRGKGNCKHIFHNDKNLHPAVFFKECSEKYRNDKFRSELKILDSSSSIEECDTIIRRLAVQGFPKHKFIKHENQNVRAALISQGYALDKFLDDESPKVREALAKQGYKLDVLLHDENPNVRKAAEERNLANERLSLFDLSDDKVREEVADFIL